MIVFHKITTKRASRGDSNHLTPDTLPVALTTALSGHNSDMPKRSNRKKLVQEQLNDEKTIKKRRFHLKKKTTQETIISHT